MIATSTMFRCKGCGRNWLRHVADGVCIEVDACPDCGDFGEKISGAEGVALAERSLTKREPQTKTKRRTLR
jgi:hypothetical protein